MNITAECPPLCEVICYVDRNTISLKLPKVAPKDCSCQPESSNLLPFTGFLLASWYSHASKVLHFRRFLCHGSCPPACLPACLPALRERRISLSISQMSNKPSLLSCACLLAEWFEAFDDVLGSSRSPL